MEEYLVEPLRICKVEVREEVRVCEIPPPSGIVRHFIPLPRLVYD